MLHYVKQNNSVDIYQQYFEEEEEEEEIQEPPHARTINIFRFGRHPSADRLIAVTVGCMYVFPAETPTS